MDRDGDQQHAEDDDRGRAGVDDLGRHARVEVHAGSHRRVARPTSATIDRRPEQAGQRQDPQLRQGRIEDAEGHRGGDELGEGGQDTDGEGGRRGVGRQPHRQEGRGEHPHDQHELELGRVDQDGQPAARGLEQHPLVDHRQLEVRVRVVDRLVPRLGHGDDGERRGAQQQRRREPAAAGGRPGAGDHAQVRGARRQGGTREGEQERRLHERRDRDLAAAAHAAERAAGVEGAQRQDEAREGQEADDHQQVPPAVERRPIADDRHQEGRHHHRGEDERRRQRRSSGPRRRSRAPPCATTWRGPGTAAGAMVRAGTGGAPSRACVIPSSSGAASRTSATWTTAEDERLDRRRDVHQRASTSRTSTAITVYAR